MATTNLYDTTALVFRGNVSDLPINAETGSVCMKDDTVYVYADTCWNAIDYAPYHHDIVYIHKTNCPNCGGLLDGDEHSPYVKCGCCGAKIWSEREVS